MIKIFSIKQEVEILIDDAVDWIQFTPRDYEIDPYVKIEMKGFYFLTLAQNCLECRKILDSYGNDDFNWIIEYNGKAFRLHMAKLNKRYGENQIKQVTSDMFSGSVLVLRFNKELPVDKKELNVKLESAVSIEDYQRACFIRDLIK